MCQKNNTPVEHPSVVCYRAYEHQNKSRDTKHRKLTSFYRGQPKPRIGVTTYAKRDPFHAFCTREDVVRWNDCNGTQYSAVVFECVLQGDLETGEWSDDVEVKTYTGMELKIVREVGHIDKGNEQIKWTRLTL